MVYATLSPNNSTTSLSDNDDDEVRDPQWITYPADVTPAQWSAGSFRHTLTVRPPLPTTSSPASRLPPEILIHVLKQLHSSRDLHSSLLVSRSWCECAVELLWHRPSFSDLSRFVKLLQVIWTDEQMFDYARFVRRLNLASLGSELTDSHFTALAKCVKLERFTLVNCSEVSDEALASVLPLCTNLVALDLTGIVCLSDQTIIALAEKAAKLQGINLGGCRNITDDGVLALAQNCHLLRRIKLAGAVNVTDQSISALAKSCPLILEIDLNGCTKITDGSVRDLWLQLGQLRELRLSQCTELTDNAFPAYPTQQQTPPPENNIFPRAPSPNPTEFPPLRLPRLYEQLRIIDLTACHLLTDEAVEGIVSSAPRLRNFMLAKCTQLTDAAVESICKLGKHLHSVQLGHANSITDRSVKSLARSCLRLRYVDFACCTLLTDLSVIELSALPKLRRIGLVRVTNLTDQAIFSLADRHSSLERIHLSYCEHITVLAIHFLLQRLPKLTHLSLTGIPAFRRHELQQFCRPPPREFNTTQRAAFCVYSGKGVGELRKYLADLMQSVQADAEGTDDTDYDDGNDDDEVVNDDSAVEEEVAAYAGDQSTTELTPRFVVNAANDSGPSQYEMHNAAARTHTRHHPLPPRPTTHRPMQGYSSFSSRTFGGRNVPQLPAREINNQPPPSGLSLTRPTNVNYVQARHRGFGENPIVEHSSPPPTPQAPSYNPHFVQVSSNVTTRRGQHPANTARMRTPELTDAELGRAAPDNRFEAVDGVGNGPTPGSSTATQNSSCAAGTPDRVVADAASRGRSAHSSRARHHAIPHRANTTDAPVHPRDRARSHGPTDALSSTHQRGVPSSDALVWPHRDNHANTAAHNRSMPRLSESPTTSELQLSVHTALNGGAGLSGPGVAPSGVRQRGEEDARGRSVKRSLRSTLNAAEQFASSFLFGRESSSQSSRTERGEAQSSNASGTGGIRQANNDHVSH